MTTSISGRSEPLQISEPAPKKRSDGMNPALSVVMPCFNERDTIRLILDRVAVAPFVAEIIVVDDGSTDGTREALKETSSAWSPKLPKLRVVFQPENRGKGAALRTGFQHAAGDLVVVQDADLEY